MNPNAPKPAFLKIPCGPHFVISEMSQPPTTPIMAPRIANPLYAMMTTKGATGNIDCDRPSEKCPTREP
jgi:hypothetical protein